VSRPSVATERLALTASTHVRYVLKALYRDGGIHVVLEPLDPMARLRLGFRSNRPAVEGRHHPTALHE
jgi:hypothetical protein